MLSQAGIADAGVMDSLHERFQAMDEDGSGCLTADDLKVEPLGLKPICNATEISNKALAWSQSVLDTTSRTNLSLTKWSRSSSVSASRRNSSSSSMADVEHKTLSAQEISPSPPQLESPPQQLMASSFDSDYDAPMVAAVVDDSSDSHQVDNSVDINESSLSIFLEEASLPKSYLSSSEAKLAVLSPRAQDRYVEDIKTKLLFELMRLGNDTAELVLKIPSQSEKQEAGATSETVAEKTTPKDCRGSPRANRASPRSLLSTEIKGSSLDSLSMSHNLSRASCTSTSPQSISVHISSSISPRSSSCELPNKQQVSATQEVEADIAAASSTTSSSASSRAPSASRSRQTGVSSRPHAPRTPRPKRRPSTPIVANASAAAASTFDYE